MDSDIRIGTTPSAAKVFEGVSKSFGTIAGHDYVKITDAKAGTLTRTSDKGQASSFKEISAFVKKALDDTSIQTEEKEQILNAYENITTKFTDKKLSWLMAIFFSLVKGFQVEDANKILKTGRLQIDTEKKIKLQEVQVDIEKKKGEIGKKETELKEEQDALGRAVGVLDTVAFADYQQLQGERIGQRRAELTKLNDELKTLQNELNKLK